MAKYSFEFKLKVVEEYLQGLGGYKYLAKKYSIPDKGTVRDWVKKYIEFGEESLLIRRKNNNKYTLDFKLNMIKSYLTTEISYHELATNFAIPNPSIIAGWVSKFRKSGKEGLIKQQGSPSKMKSKNNKSNKVSRINKNDLMKYENENKLQNKAIRYLNRVDDIFNPKKDVKGTAGEYRSTGK
ncbi:MAG: transposase [Miniphocaeibacter sp.]|uniref:helix-turn-helix domain-containing protein n=1 Tax=Miniphocaeibacter sp. TaxID=3100973 RepID=UPI001833E18D|nr:transposase [Gallicola sp.]